MSRRLRNLKGAKMKMSDLPTIIDEFNAYMTDELEADADEIRDNYPKLYAAMLAMFVTEQQEGGAE